MGLSIQDRLSQVECALGHSAFLEPVVVSYRVSPWERLLSWAPVPLSFVRSRAERLLWVSRRDR